MCGFSHSTRDDAFQGDGFFAVILGGEGVMRECRAAAIITMGRINWDRILLNPSQYKQNAARTGQPPISMNESIRNPQLPRNCAVPILASNLPL
jgi:hypothetical protein